MLIERGQQIAGLDAVVVRGLMRSMHSTALSAGRIREKLVLSESAVAILIAQLQSDGFIERCSDSATSWRTADEEHTVDYWIATVLGNALGKARIGKPIPRAKAEKLLSAFLDRVRESNADPDELYWVDTVGLYGSLADESRTAVGDVDLRVVFSPRHRREEHDRRSEEIIERAVRDGRSFPDWLKRMGWPRLRFERRLRASSSLLDIQFDSDPLDVGIPPGATVVEIYRRPVT